jgi:hypothetical protein
MWCLGNLMATTRSRRVSRAFQNFAHPAFAQPAEDGVGSDLAAFQNGHTDPE